MDDKKLAENALNRFWQDLLPDPHDERDIDASWIRRRWEKYEPVIRKALSAPRVPDGLHITIARKDAELNNIGNQLHNLSCRHQNNEELCAALSELRDLCWRTAQHPCDAPGMPTDLRTEVEELKAKLAVAKRDSERLDFLERSQGDAHVQITQSYEGIIEIEVEVLYNGKWLVGEGTELREAIDAACQREGDK